MACKQAHIWHAPNSPTVNLHGPSQTLCINSCHHSSVAYLAVPKPCVPTTSDSGAELRYPVRKGHGHSYNNCTAALSFLSVIAYSTCTGHVTSPGRPHSALHFNAPKLLGFLSMANRRSQVIDSVLQIYIHVIHINVNIVLITPPPPQTLRASE